MSDRLEEEVGTRETDHLGDVKSSQALKIHQRGVQWKQGVVVHIIL